MNDEEFMRLAIDEAKNASGDGEKNGIGAIIVKDNKIISKGHNNVKKSGDPTAHAEINAIRRATNKLKNRHLEGCILYTTCEPCPMCFAAAWWAKMSKIVYGVSISDIIKMGKRQINVNCSFLNEKGSYQIDIKGGVLQEECLQLF